MGIGSEAFQPGTEKPGWWVPVLRGGNLMWLLVFGLALIGYTYSLQGRYGGLFISENVDLSLELLNFAVSRQMFTRYLLVLQSLAVGAFLLAALLIFTKRCLRQGEPDRVAWLVSMVLLLPVFFFVDRNLLLRGRLNEVISLLIGILTFLLGWGIINLLFLFPDGKFVPRRSKPMLIFANTWFFITFLLGGIFDYLGGYGIWDLPGNVGDAWWGITIALLAGFTGFGLASQVYRYLRVSTPAQRQQTKWVVASLVAQLTWLLAIAFPTGSEYPVAERLAGFVLLHLGILLPLLIPLAFIISILRFNLWDIDIILRRTLLYGSLTFILLVIYLIAVVAFQQLFGQITGETSPLGIVLSTLLIAALFTPLRRRLQASIDRRFFRRRYDAQGILDHFSARARDMVDLEQIHGEMLQAVWQALQPGHTTLWLQESGDLTKSGKSKDFEVEK